VLNKKIICGDEEGSSIKQTVMENIVIETYDNAEGLYIDGTADGDSPVYIGVTKSSGSKGHKQPLEKGDLIGGLQVYGRTEDGHSLGYNHCQTPLRGSIIFKISDEDKNASELLIAVTENNYPTVKLVVDSFGNLKLVGNISIGSLTITDKKVNASQLPVEFVKVFYHDKEYAIPLHLIQETDF